VTDPPGLAPHVRHAIVFDPQQNVMAFLGHNDENPRNNFIWFYRYAAGSAGAGPASAPRP